MCRGFLGIVTVDVAIFVKEKMGGPMRGMDGDDVLGF